MLQAHDLLAEYPQSLQNQKIPCIPLRIISNISMTCLNYIRMSAPSLTQHTLAANKSALYLKQSKAREEKRDQILALTISKGKNEYEYDCLIKMGEANEMIQALGETITYRAYRGAVRSKHNLFIYIG